MDLDDTVNIRHPPLDLAQALVHVSGKPGVLSLNRELVTRPETPFDKLLPGCVLSHSQILGVTESQGRVHQVCCMYLF